MFNFSYKMILLKIELLMCSKTFLFNSLNYFKIQPNIFSRSVSNVDIWVYV